MATAAQLKEIGKQVALHTKYMTDFLRTDDYGYVKLFDVESGTLVRPPGAMRRFNDFVAAAYTHSIAISAGSGDDCIDEHGNVLELKLVYIFASDMRLGVRGTSIMTGTAENPNGLGQSVNAKFRVYNGTNPDHHTKDTALVLMSGDHNCFITGFMMPGDLVKEYVHSDTKNTIQRDVSLSQFATSGSEFGSSIPHIGWENYYNALFNYLCAKEGRITGDLAQAAIDRWASFADERNLQKL